MSASGTKSSRNGRHPMAWQNSLGEMIGYGVKVHATCSSCGLWKPVDVVALAVARGEDYSLWGKRQRCRTPGCDGQVFFHAANPGGPSRPLLP